MCGIAAHHFSQCLPLPRNPVPAWRQGAGLVMLDIGGTLQAFACRFPHFSPYPPVTQCYVRTPHYLKGTQGFGAPVPEILYTLFYVQSKT
jgi:hypothetical protein